MHPDQRDNRFVDAFGTSVRGRRRSRNSDQFVVAELRRAAHVRCASEDRLDNTRQLGSQPAHVLMVADGVSDHPAARRASSLAIESLMTSLLDSLPWSPELDVESEANLRTRLQEAFLRADERLGVEARREVARHGMATTLTLAFVRWPEAFIVHAGDSRAYVVRGDGIRQVTRDHTVAQRMLDRGVLTPERAARSPMRNVLWNSIGGSDSVTPELATVRLEAGDALLLCSDGLSGSLDDEVLRRTVQRSDSAQSACEALTATAQAFGSQDDITAVLARFRDEAADAAAAAPRPPAEDAVAALRIPDGVPAEELTA